MALIGVSGKIGSGKDLVGDIINFLTSEYYTPSEYSINYTLEDSFKDFQDYTIIDYKHKFEIKKFADKLKDIVCMLIGCSRKDLENREFKEKPLEKQWWNFSLGGGKRYVLPYIGEYSDSDRKIMEGRYEEKMTPRLMLQLLGTEAGRQVIHQNIWVNALFSDYNKTYNWVITDVRFTNEADVILEKGGIVIRINRPCKECNGVSNHKLDCSIGRVEHLSEKSLDDYGKFSYIVDNVGTIPDLIHMIKNILKKENII